MIPDCLKNVKLDFEIYEFIVSHNKSMIKNKI